MSENFISVIGGLDVIYEETYDLEGCEGVIPISNILPYPLGNLAGTVYNLVNQVQYPVAVPRYDGKEWRGSNWLESRLTWIAVVGCNKEMYREAKISLTADTKDLLNKWVKGETLTIRDVFPDQKKESAKSELTFIYEKGTGSFLDKQKKQERSENTLIHV